MLAESHVLGSDFGELQLAMWKRQFAALRDGDRFYYLNDPALALIERDYGISARRTLAQVIRDNTDEDVRDDVFRLDGSPAFEHREGGVGATVAPTLSLTLGPPATFGAFTPGVARDYTATTTATIITTAGDAALTTRAARSPTARSPSQRRCGSRSAPRRGPSRSPTRRWRSPYDRRSPPPTRCGRAPTRAP